MKAAILYAPNTPVAVKEAEIDEPQEGEVLLDVVGAGVCHSDYHYVTGHRTIRRAPMVLGHEGAGTVRAVGPGVRDFAPGDKVILSLDAMCGSCRNCSNGRPALCETYRPEAVSRMRVDGEPVYHGRPTYVEQTLVQADACVKVPEDTTLESACLVSCGIITGIGAVVNRAKVETARRWPCLAAAAWD